jgi:hypothetical protein
MDVVKLAEELASQPVAVVLIVGFVLFFTALKKEWLVMGGNYRDVKSQRDRLLDLALDSVSIAKTLAPKAATRGRGGNAGSGEPTRRTG